MKIKHLLFLLIFANTPPLLFAQTTNTVTSSDAIESISKADTAILTPDSAALRKAERKNFERQLRVGVELIRPITGFIVKNTYRYELLADYTLRENTYLVAEAGFGGGKIDYPNLHYNASNFFFKAGLDASMLDRLDKTDWDMVFVGFRYGIGIGQRSEATYIIDNPFGSSTQNTVSAKNFIAHWGEITAGMRIEVLPKFFAGWNVRAKFFLNSGTFEGEVSPNYIAGYGKGDKTTVFDINFYILYAIRWKP